MRVLAPAVAEVDPELLLGGVLVEEVICEMVSVAEEQSATVASWTRWNIPPARRVIKPECYRIQPPYVRLCVVDMKVKK
jgi:hypothetical protein